MVAPVRVSSLCKLLHVSSRVFSARAKWTLYCFSINFRGCYRYVNVKKINVHHFIGNFEIKPMKRKALRKQSLHQKTAASVLPKPFISSNEWRHTTDASPPSAWAELPFSNVNNIHVHSMIPEDQKNMTTQWCSTFGWNNQYLCIHGVTMFHFASFLRAKTILVSCLADIIIKLITMFRLYPE